MIRRSPKRENLYLRCSDLPLDIFIECIVEDKFNRLVRHGTPSQMQISNAWGIIITEYSELSDSQSYRQILSLSREVGILKAKKTSIEICLDLLMLRYSQRCVDILRELGYRISYETYKKDILSIRTKSNTIDIQLKQKQIEYDDMFKNLKKTERKQFDDTLSVLSKFMGYRVDPRQITVSEYVAMLKFYNNSSRKAPKE